MKIIFSRKGFDSQFGKQPSPVLPDGTLLSLPIPRKGDINTFGELFYKDKSYFDIIRELKPATTLNAGDTCHLDPDIRKDIGLPQPKDRVSVFGQCDAALTVLKKYNIKKDDIFLFFGWFQETEYAKDGKLRYKKSAPHLHIIYGYLQIEEVYSCSEEVPSYVQHHAHLNGSFADVKNNSIYVGASHFTLNNSYPGSGCFTYHPDLILTAEGMTRSRWKPHPFFKQPMTYHHSGSFRENYFQSAAQGQEFILEGNGDLVCWMTDLIEKNFKRSLP